MNLVSDLDLPVFDYSAPDFSADRYHQQLAETSRQGWLAKSPLAYIVLDHDSGEFFLRSRATAFPGRQIAEFFGVTGGPLADHIDANILNLTGERHRRLRALVGPAFTPRRADRWRPVMRGFLEDLWSQAAPNSSCDFVAAVARPFPSLTIATVLGAPHQDAERLQEWSSWVQRQFDIRALSTNRDDIEQAVVEVQDYVTALLEDRRAAPADDLISDLLAARDPEEGGGGVGGGAVGRGMRTARGEPAGRGDRHHHRSTGARHPVVRRASRPVGTAGRRSRAGPACRRRGAAVRAGHAVHGANLPGAGRAPRRDLPGRHDRGGLHRTGQPGRRGGGGVRHHHDPRRPAAHVRRRDALLPGLQPGPGGTGRGPGVPRAAYSQPRPRRSGAAGRGRRHLRNRQAPDHLVGLSPGEPRARRHIRSPCSSAASASPEGLPMQAPVRGADWRSLKVGARLPERTSAPVLSLELARDAEQHPDTGAGTVTGG